MNLCDLPAEDYQELISETYTVVRTGGWMQHGWRIPAEAHECPADARDSIYMHGLACNRLNSGGYLTPLEGERHPWRVYMVFEGEVSDLDAKKHACGWRRSATGERTFWPTRLDGDPAAQEAWGLKLDGLLNSLKSGDELALVEASRMAAEKAVANAEAYRLSQLEANYQADEPARHAARKALLENPVASATMMAEMRGRETTGSRCLRNNAIPIPPGSNFALKIKELEAISVHDADRLRRLFDNGCPKAIVHWLAGFHIGHSDRNLFITEEEAKLFLEPLAQPYAG